MTFWLDQIVLGTAGATKTTRQKGKPEGKSWPTWSEPGGPGQFERKGDGWPVAHVAVHHVLR